MAKKRNRKYLMVGLLAVILWVIGLLAWYLHAKNFAVLNPAGTIAHQERHLMIVTVLLGLIVVIPVYVMLFSFAWRYREGNKRASYSPKLAGNRLAETVWWGIPLIIIGILSVITWQTSHSLDPHKQLASNQKALNIQVVALDWKWLFIYPDQGVASLNVLNMPVNVPVKFHITADAPMNSFWIPQLGSQIYAMPGMSSHLNLIADKVGRYNGASANISGRGFADMHFTVDATSEDDFKNWLRLARSAALSLDMEAYNKLSKPGIGHETTYSSIDKDLYNKILLKYMGPGQ